MAQRRNRIPNEVRERLVRAYEDPAEDYLMVAGTLGVNRSTARGEEGDSYNQVTKQVDEIEAPSCCKGKECDSCSQVTKRVDEIEAPSCCKGDTVGTNTCCAQALACKGVESPPCECGTTNSKDQNISREICRAPEKELERQTTSSFCGGDQKEPCCSSRKVLDGSCNVRAESCFQSNVTSEKAAQTTSCCQNKSCCPFKKQCDDKANAFDESGSQRNVCCETDVDKKLGERSCLSYDKLIESNLAPCLKEMDKYCTSTKQRDNELQSKSKSSVHEKKVLLQPNTCCSCDTVPREKRESCCFNSKSCCSSEAEGKDRSSSFEEKSRPTCSNSDQNDKCCEKENKGEYASTDVEVDCCKVNQETVLLIESGEEQLTHPRSSAPLKTKASHITTKLRVQNICCAMEVQVVQECLKPLQGVEKVSVNVIGRVVHVRHDPDVTSQKELVESLNRVHLGATVMEMGVQHDKDQDNVLFSLELVFIYVFIQMVLLITAVTGFFLNQPWYMWVAITEIVFGGVPIMRRGLISAKNLKLDINILFLVAVIGTLAINEWVEGATVVCVFAFADALQEFCMFKVQRTISGLMLKRPEVAVLVETGESAPLENVAVGTVIAVRPGELIPLDGVVAKGKATVDESSITGESLPVEKTVFSKVYSGTVNQNGYIEVETTSDLSSSTVSKVAQMVQEAQSSATKTEAIINRFAKYYTPLIVLVAALVVIVPAILGASGVGSYLQDIREWGRRALVMLVIACPCALVMATPIAVVCSITAAARKGALVKGGDHLETLAKIKILAFDKTGTLTEGKFQVMHMECAYGENEREVLRFAAGLESKSVHPIAAAIVNEFSGCVAEMVKNQINNFPEVHEFKMYEGQGISGLIEGKLVRVGNKEMVDQCGASLNETMADKYKLWSTESKTVVFVCVDEKLALMIGLADAIRPNTSISLDWLRNIGVQTSMITGDNSRTAEAVRRNLGIDECVSEMKPHEKLAWIQQKQSNKGEQDSGLSLDEEDQSWKCCRWSRDHYVMVGMVGDGVNDGPALAAANVGIAMGAGGTALAVEAADVALMSNELASIPELISLARFCNQIVKENIAFSVLLKICIVIVALLGYVTLWMAVVVDVLGLLFVILNGLRPLLNFGLFDCLLKPKGWERVGST